MVVMQIKERLTIVIAILAGVLAVVFLTLTKSTIGLVISTLLTSFIGFLIEHYLLEKHPKSHWLYKLRHHELTTEDEDDETVDESGQNS